MKSLLTRFASIGTIFSLVLAGLSATTPAQIAGPSASVHVHKGAISFDNTTIVKVTAVCSGGGLGTLNVEVIQTADQSSNGQATGASNVTETVKCNGQPQNVAVSPFGFTYNIGEATATVMLMVNGVPVASTTRTIVLRFPVIEGMEQEQGGND